MLHIGHFSFDAIDPESNVQHGYFTCILDTRDADTAVAEFARHIAQLQHSERLFENIIKVYLEDIIAVKKAPLKAVLTHMQSSDGPFPSSVSHTLPYNTSEGIEAYGLRTNVERQEYRGEEDGYLNADPLITFERRHGPQDL